MSDICTVKREPYIRNTTPGVAPMIGVRYTDGGLRRQEDLSEQGTSDLGRNFHRRVSADNGRTWSAWELKMADLPTQGDCHREEFTWCYLADPASGKVIEGVFLRLFLGDPKDALREGWKGHQLYFDHGFYRLADGSGERKTGLRQFRYEEGAAFDEGNWACPDFLRTNAMYIGYNMIRLSDGRIAFAASIAVPYQDDEDDRVTGHIPSLLPQGTVCGQRCFFGTWNATRGDYDWDISAPALLPRRISTRGLMEADIAELRNGDLLLDMRGSNAGMDPLAVPGRHWRCVSKDKGRTWSPVTDWRFDTGEPFYSPSSFARMIRSTKTGKLYWVGNISDTPAAGNQPRYPLYIAEIDEAMPALKKASLTVIDQRDPARDAASLQLSNFSLLENRETLELEIYLTRIGEKGSAAPALWTADAWKYTLTL